MPNVVITTKYAGNCALCEGNLVVGDKVVWNTNIKTIYCYDHETKDLPNDEE